MKNMTGAIYVAGALDYETRKRVSIPDNARKNIICERNETSFPGLLSSLSPLKVGKLVFRSLGKTTKRSQKEISNDADCQQGFE